MATKSPPSLKLWRANYAIQAGALIAEVGGGGGGRNRGREPTAPGAHLLSPGLIFTPARPRAGKTGDEAG